jgi:hypothetical protein
MTPDNLNEVASTLGLSTSDLALLTGNTTRAVQYWYTGKNPIPQSVMILLNAMSAGQLDMDWVVEEVSRLTHERAYASATV